MPRPDETVATTPHPGHGAAGVNGPANEVLTLSEAAAYLRLSEPNVLRLVREQGLPARQLDSEWRLLKTAIQDWLRVAPPPQSNKDAWMALAAAWRDDPFREEMVQAIYHGRGRPMTESNS